VDVAQVEGHGAVLVEDGGLERDNVLHLDSVRGLAGGAATLPCCAILTLDEKEWILFF
jgi:hypothetical protein